VSDAEAYARVPYPGLAFPQTHPDRLALLALLHGLQPAPPDRARILEVGCADGMNLVAMAGHAPCLTAAGFDIVDPALGRRAAAEHESAGLSRRELEVMRLVAVGRTNREIAQELFLSPRTVDMHLRNILAKLGCRSRTEAATRGGELGLLAT